MKFAVTDAGDKDPIYATHMCCISCIGRDKLMLRVRGQMTR